MVHLVDRLASLPAPEAEPRSRNIHFRKTRKYPGRSRVMHRSDAADAKMAQFLREEIYDTPVRNRCENPFITSAIGLPGFSGTCPEIPPEFWTEDGPCRRCR